MKKTKRKATRPSIRPTIQERLDTQYNLGYDNGIREARERLAKKEAELDADGRHAQMALAQNLGEMMDALAHAIGYLTGRERPATLGIR